MMAMPADQPRPHPPLFPLARMLLHACCRRSRIIMLMLLFSRTWWRCFTCSSHARPMPIFRFSFSWNRLLPQGGRGTPVNPEGVAFYNDMINEMLKNGIYPAATMFHCGLASGRDGGLGGKGKGWRFT